MKDFLKLRAPLSGLLCGIRMHDNDDGTGGGGGDDNKNYMTAEQYNKAAKGRETKLLKLFEDKLAASNTTLTEQVTASIADAFKAAAPAGGDKDKDKGKDKGAGGVSPEVEARLKAAEDRATAAEDRSKKLEDDRQAEKTRGLRQGEKTALQAALVKANVIPDMLEAAMAVHTSRVVRDTKDGIAWDTKDELDPHTSIEKGLAEWAKTSEAAHFIGTAADARGSGGRRSSGSTGGKRKDGKATAEDVGEFLEDFI